MVQNVFRLLGLNLRVTHSGAKFATSAYSTQAHWGRHKCSQTYSRKARIRVTSSSPDGAEHVGLVYEDAVEQHDTELQSLKSHGGYTPTPSIHESEYNQSEQELRRPNVHSHSRSMLERTLRPLQVRPYFRSLNASTLQADSQGYASGARVSGFKRTIDLT